MAFHFMTGGNLVNLGWFFYTDILCDRASRVEPASGREINGGWDFPCQGDLGNPGIGIRRRAEIKKGFGIGVTWILKEFCATGRFHDLP